MNGQQDARHESTFPLRASPLGERQTVVLGWHPDHIVGQAHSASIKPIPVVAPFCSSVSLFLRGGAAPRHDLLLANCRREMDEEYERLKGGSHHPIQEDVDVIAPPSHPACSRRNRPCRACRSSSGKHLPADARYLGNVVSGPGFLSISFPPVVNPPRRRGVWP
jgi:hypothetical protein